MLKRGDERPGAGPWVGWCTFALLESVQMTAWSPAQLSCMVPFKRGCKAWCSGAAHLSLLFFPYRYFFLLSTDNYSSKIGRELFVFLLYCKYSTCQTVTLEIIKSKESCFVRFKPGLPLMVSSSGVRLFCFTCLN